MRISSYVNHPAPVQTEPTGDESLASGLEPTQRLSDVRRRPLPPLLGQPELTLPGPPIRPLFQLKSFLLHAFTPWGVTNWRFGIFARD